MYEGCLALWTYSKSIAYEFGSW